MKNMAGDFLGAGVGECSSNEDKYKWKKAFNNKEWEETPEDQRREKWRTYKEKEYKAKQILTNPADEANTVLKMAKKRALVDGVLTCTAASDIFEQDKEDFDQNGDKQQGKPKVQKPQSKSSKKETKNTDGPPPAMPPGEEEAVTPETVKDVFTQDEPVTDEDLRDRISSMLFDMCEGAPDKITEMLKKYTTFQGDKGEVSCTDITRLKGKWLKTTYGNVKKAWEESTREPGSDG
jgi:hypothetical protein